MPAQRAEAVDPGRVDPATDPLGSRRSAARRCHLRAADELLATRSSTPLREAQTLIADLRVEYNTSQRHYALDGLTPAEFGEPVWDGTNQHSHNSWTTHRGTPHPSVRDLRR